jgi:ketosteroid isomerase-like protein
MARVSRNTSAMDDLERLVAIDQIRQLASRYAVAMDARDLDALVALFVEDVRVGADLSGREALRESFDRQLREIGISILFVGNHVIDFQDDQHATGVVYCKGEIQDGDRWVHQAIRYQDRYERRDDEWRFVRRIHRLFYGIAYEPGAAANPLALAPANWPENHAGKGTLPESLEPWQRFWKRE